MTIRDDVIMAKNIYLKSAWKDLSYEVSYNPFKLKDTILPIFGPLWRHNGSFPGVSDVIKSSPFLNENPCQVLSKSLEPFLNKTDLTLKSRFFEISSCCYDVIMRAKPHSNYQYWRWTLNEQNQGTILHGRQSLLKIRGQNLKNRHFSARLRLWRHVMTS